MGEENTFAGVGKGFYFCKKEDIGTENEKWHEAKLDNIQVRKSIDVPELDTEIIAEEREGFPVSFTFSIEPSEEQEKDILRLFQKIRKQQRGNRHYRRKLLKRIPKKELRRLIYVVRKFNIPSDIL